MSSGRSLLGLSFCSKPAAAPKLSDHFAGVHQKHADVVFAQFLTPAFGHAAQGEFAGIVCRAVGRAPMRRCRPDVHDVPAILLDEVLGRFRAIRIAPVTLVAKVRSKLAQIEIDQFLEDPKPALLTRMSRSPNFSRISRMVRWTSASLDTSAWIGCAPSSLAAFSSLRLIAPGDGHARAAIDQALGDAVSDARTTAGDESYCIFQIHSHISLSQGFRRLGNTVS